MIVIPAPPGSQVGSYCTDEDGRREILWQQICAVLLSEGPANCGQLTHAVTIGGPPVEIGSGVGWVSWGERIL